MAEEIGLEGNLNNYQATASTSHSPIEVANETSGKKDDQQDSENSKGEESVGTVPYYRLFSFADSNDVLLMIIGTIASVGNGVCMPIMTILFGDLINAFGENANSKNTAHEVSKIALKFVYLAAGSGVASLLQVSCWMVTGERQAARIRSLYLKAILRQDVAFFDKETNTGEVVGRMAGDTVLIQDSMGEKVGKFIQLFSTFTGGFTIAFTKGWLLTLVLLSSIPLLVISGALMAIVVSKMASRGQAAYSQAGIVVDQTVASFTGEKHAIIQYEKYLKKAYESGVHEGLASGLGFGAVMLIVFCTYALAVWFGGKMIIEKGYNGGVVINIIIAVLTGSLSLGQASPCLGAFASGRAAAYKMFETINRKPQIDSSDTNGCILDDILGDIELRDVCFSYPARPDEPIFDGFSLSMHSGTTSALVGQSGSGKSTVISLIERFYDPQAGEILIDGINLREFQLRWIREKIGLVGQEPVLFSSSIKDNIAYGKDGATIEEITAAAELANAAKFIDKLPQGLDTLVDEATSALDVESEHVVQEALDRIMVNRTTVIVAHRLSTIKNADMIAVVHQGKVVEKGSHLELLKDPDGAYCQLIRLQEVNRCDKEKAENVGLARNPSERHSFGRSISLASSGRGNSSRRSFSVSFGIPIGHIEETVVTDSECTPPAAIEQPQEVPRHDLPI
ncbi:hypothetical protein IFM89_038276 [Coptis chinensis]|uniref:Uncharacterized protein n=1 Tax=Coptis chinensis TaxID=261450 RepID=A0A835IIJ5_9MAGN|nr:hypothetical protein IFM89_038276 [Coptis chinensis]